MERGGGSFFLDSLLLLCWSSVGPDETKFFKLFQFKRKGLRLRHTHTPSQPENIPPNIQHQQQPQPFLKAL